MPKETEWLRENEQSHPLLSTFPDYVGLEGTAEAATLVRKRSTTPLVGLESLCALGYMFFKWEIKKAAEVKRSQIVRIRED